MRRPSLAVAIPLLALVGAAAFAGYDLQKVERGTMVVYTTSALKQYLEHEAVPEFTRLTGIPVSLVYLTAGAEYNRVRLNPERPEADLFLHASPLFLERGHEDGLFEPFRPNVPLAPGTTSRPVDGGFIWTAFAWSPLVVVYAEGLDKAPDIAAPGQRIGLAHPVLSNNGIYAVLLFETFDPAAGQRALANTVVQPTNAQATIQGVADRSYDATLGYEAVARFFQQRGAKVQYDVPSLGGQQVTTSVLFSAAIVRNHPHPGAEQFVDLLLSPLLQSKLAGSYMRPVTPGHPPFEGAVDLEGVQNPPYDWSKWATLEASLKRYEVNR